MQRLKGFLAHNALVVFTALMLGLTRLPLHLHFLAFVCLIPLFSWFERRQSVRSVIKAGFVFSFVYTLTALHWLALTANHAELPHQWEAPLMIGIPVGLIVLFGAYFAILFLLVRLAWRSRWRLWTVAGLWLGFEWVQNLGEFRFPWHNLGYAIAPYTVLLQPAELGGVYLVSLLVFAVNALLWRGGYYVRRREMLVCCAVMLLWLGYGVVRMRTLPVTVTDTRVGVIQASIPQDRKWDPLYETENMELYRVASESLAAAGADLVIWPESAITLPLLHAEYSSGSRGRAFVTSLSGKIGRPIFTGFPHFASNTPDDPHYDYKPYLYYNACSQIRPSGVEPPYYKIALVPFGERMPWLNTFPFLWKVQMGQANFEYGEGPVYFTVDSLRYSPLICFEMALPSITRRIAAGDADFIVNISNDGWFGRSSGTWQHAQMSRYRAIETRRSVFRAANTGVSMVVDPLGRTLDRAGMFEVKEMLENVPVVNFLTPFCRGGYLLPVIAGALALIATLATALQSKHTDRAA